jgi:hypothetical protein
MTEILPCCYGPFIYLSRRISGGVFAGLSPPRQSSGFFGRLWLYLLPVSRRAAAEAPRSRKQVDAFGKKIPFPFNIPAGYAVKQQTPGPKDTLFLKQ